MESIDEISKNNSNKKGFFKHVFNFDEDSKEEILNIIQYAILALIPIIILNKAIQKFVPEADDEKGNVEILAEIILQVIVMFIGILIIHRIITYIPTYSGAKYADFSVTNIILAVLLIILSLQTKLGEKVSILFDRISEIWDGAIDNKDKKKDKDKKKSKGQGQVRVSQPISQTPGINQMGNQTTSLSLLPPPQLSTEPMTNSANNSLPDYNTNSNNESVPTSMYENFAPMAANEALGGSGFGASNW
jgi:hypothetical protein